jgi:hypothetical protein
VAERVKDPAKRPSAAQILQLPIMQRDKNISVVTEDDTDVPDDRIATQV